MQGRGGNWNRDGIIIFSPGIGDPISSGPFQLPDAERFVAVFTGTLGDEVQDPPRFTGAVIGKVLGGARVEQLFSDGNRWNIRTPDGIYPLPILNDIQELVWGDADNMLVGRTAIGPTALNQFVLYRIDRGPGDPVIPLTASGDIRLVNANPPRVARQPSHC